jgi:hypothetical protein
MARQTRSALIQREQALLGVQGKVVHRHGCDQIIRQGLNQGLPIGGAAKSRQQPPSFIGWIEAAAVSHQMPPADAGLGRIAGTPQAFDPIEAGEIHHPQVQSGQGGIQAEQGLQGQGLADGGIEWPSGAHGFHPFPDEALMAQAGLPRWDQHRSIPRLLQQQCPFEKVKRRHLIAAGDAHGTHLDLIGVRSQFTILPSHAEGTPQAQSHRGFPVQIQSLRTITP